MKYKSLISNPHTTKPSDDVSDSTIALLTPMWCRNFSNNIKYINHDNSLSKLICKTYPECWKSKKLRDISKSDKIYTIEQVSKECHIQKDIIKYLPNMCLHMNNFTGNIICNRCENHIQINKPALIIAGGPSLDTYKHLELLKEYGFKGDIFCVTFILKKLLDNDIIPNYIHSLDGEGHNTPFIDDERLHKNYDKITAILSTIVHPTTVELFKGNKYFYTPYIDNISHLFHLITDTPQIPACGNVGSATIVLAAKLGYNPIVLIGLDLSWESFEKMKEYDDKKVYSWNPNKNMVQKEWTKDNYKQLINPVHDKPYYIDTVFESYKTTTIKYIELKSHQNINIINCTEQGALHGKDINSMKFIDYLRNQ